MDYDENGELIFPQAGDGTEAPSPPHEQEPHGTPRPLDPFAQMAPFAPPVPQPHDPRPAGIVPPSPTTAPPGWSETREIPYRTDPASGFSPCDPVVPFAPRDPIAPDAPFEQHDRFQPMPAPFPPFTPAPPERLMRPEDVAEIAEAVRGAVRDEVREAVGEAVDALSADAQDGDAGGIGKILGETRELRKLYHNEFAGRLSKMQAELDEYHNMDKGRMFDGIYQEIANVYCSNIAVLDGIGDDKTRRKVSYLFMDIEQILVSGGLTKHETEEGQVPDFRFSQIARRIPTGDAALDKAVARSASPGFRNERRAIVKELVDIYVYEP